MDASCRLYYLMQSKLKRKTAEALPDRLSYLLYTDDICQLPHKYSNMVEYLKIVETEVTMTGLKKYIWQKKAMIIHHFVYKIVIFKI